MRASIIQRKRIMPIYNFKCNECNNIIQENMSISIFLSKRDDIRACESCNSGAMLLSLSPPNGRVEKRKEDILMDIEEELRDIVKRVRDGDEATIEDVYGHRVNPHK
jgi:hypothetical protein